MTEYRDNFDDGIYMEDKEGQTTVHNLNNVSYRVQINNLSEKVFGYYERIKNELLAYNNVISRIYVAKECFYIGADTVAKFNLVGNDLYFFIKVNPADNGRAALFNTPNHNVNEDKVFTLVRLNGDIVFQKAQGLIRVLMSKYDNNNNN